MEQLNLVALNTQQHESHTTHRRGVRLGLRVVATAAHSLAVCSSRILSFLTSLQCADTGWLQSNCRLDVNAEALDTHMRLSLLLGDEEGSTGAK